MCVVLAAMDMLNAKPELGFSVHLTVWQTFSWLTVAGLIGVLLAVPLRRHYIDEENLTFADGTAAGEALLVLDQGPKEAGPRVTALGVGETPGRAGSSRGTTRSAAASTVCGSGNRR